MNRIQEINNKYYYTNDDYSNDDLVKDIENNKITGYIDIVYNFDNNGHFVRQFQKDKKYLPVILSSNPKIVIENNKLLISKNWLDKCKIDIDFSNDGITLSVPNSREIKIKRNK